MDHGGGYGYGGDWGMGEHGGMGHHSIGYGHDIDYHVGDMQHAHFPHGELAHGIGGGLGYCLHHSYSDMDLAHHIALMSGSGDGLHGFHEVFLHQCPTLHVHGHEQMQFTDSRKVLLPGIGRTDTTVEVLFWPHAKRDPESPYTECDPRKELKRLLRRNGLIDITVVDGQWRASDRVPEQEINGQRVTVLQSNRPFDARQDMRNMPSSHYKGARGHTRIWQDHYRLPAPWWNPFAEKNQWTHLAIFGATPYYGHPTNDCETRISISVYSLPFVKAGLWEYRWSEIKRHRKSAELVAVSIYDYLNRFKVDAATLETRRMLAEIEARARQFAGE